MKTLTHFANWKVLLGLFSLTALFSFIIFPHYQGKINTLAKEELESLDVRQAYTLDDVIYSFDKMGAEGRTIYTFTAGRIDMIFPIVYGLFFILLLLTLLKKVTPVHSPWRYLSLLPLPGIIADYAENFNILSLLNTYPKITASAVATTCQLTQLKWLFLSASLGLVVFLLIRWLVSQTGRNDKAPLRKPE